MFELSDIHAAQAELKAWHEAQPKLSPLPFGSINWTYDGDEHVEAVTRRKVLVMGVNAGGGNGATTPGMTTSERAWRTKCERLTQTAPSETVFAELVSISTKTVGELGTGLTSLVAAINASAKLNGLIIRYHRPKVVYQPGLLGELSAAVVEAYGLKNPRVFARGTHPGHTLMVHYSMEDGTPWISFKHFASFGFSGCDRTQIREYVAGLSSRS